MRIDSAAGASSAPPRPCAARKTISDASDQARPERSELTVNRAMPATNRRRRPSWSASLPPRSSAPPKRIAYAVITHCRLSSEKWRSLLIAGSATFTMATSRMTMNCAATITASASHRLVSCWPWIEACGIRSLQKSLMNTTIAKTDGGTRYTCS
jgi:hypothetical protein